MPQVHRVPLLDLKRNPPDLERELREAFERVLASGYFILGEEVAALEAECADYIGVKHAVGVSSGTDALLLALMALEIGPGDEVICPTFTFFATAGSIWRAGARPVFVDSLAESFNCDPAAVAAAVTPSTRAILPVHLFGQCAEMGPMLEAARERGVAIVEDAAQAIGSEYGDRRAGALGDIGCFSFFPSKNLGALGEAGLVTTGDDGLAERLRELRVHGGKLKYYHDRVGGNFRMDALQAALLRPKLKRLDEATSRRQANAARYTELLSDAGLAGAPAGDSAPLTLPAARQSRHIFNQFIIRVNEPHSRDALREFLTSRDIGTEIYYPLPLHLQKCFASLGHKEGDFPVAEAAAKQTLALPIFPELTDDEIRYVVEAIERFVRRSAGS